jgi:GTP-binding protein
MTGLIAIVGRPNVGKSALFNRIAGRRIAIVHDRPGVTRDRVMAECEWNGHPFSLVDTGGIGLLRGERAEDRITEAAYEQVQIAIESASVILLVVNIQEGIVPLDEEVARRLRDAGKPVLVVVNKADTSASEAGLDEFSALGFPHLFAVSAIHHRGIDDLMEAALSHLPPPPPAAEASDPDADESDEEWNIGEGEVPPGPRKERAAKPVRLAIVGRPNVGKSSIINALTGSQRVIVSPIPGTTRDAVDVPFEVDTDGVRQSFVLVDTAGLRKARKVEDTVEFFSTERTREAIINCDIAVLVLDAENGIVEQDKKIADLITSHHRACIVVVNKWDLVAEAVREAREKEVERRKDVHRDDREKRLTTLAEFGEWVQEKLFFLDYAPVIFTSATDGFQLDRLLEAVRYVATQLKQHVPTAILNRTLRDAVDRRQPVSRQGHRLKFFYATQTLQQPPTVLLFLNRDDLLTPAYEKYLAGELRAAFGFEGCPIMLVPKSRPKTIEPVRKFRQPGAAADAPVERRGAARKAWERKMERIQRPAKRPSPGSAPIPGKATVPTGGATARPGGKPPVSSVQDPIQGPGRPTREKSSGGTAAESRPGRPTFRRGERSKEKSKSSPPTPRGGRTKAAPGRPKAGGGSAARTKEGLERQAREEGAAKPIYRRKPSPPRLKAR